MGERASEKERERGRDFCLFEPRSISVRRGLFESISRRRKRREREKGGGRENTNDRMEMEEKRFGTGLDGGKKWESERWRGSHGGRQSDWNAGWTRRGRIRGESRGREEQKRNKILDIPHLGRRGGPRNRLRDLPSNVRCVCQTCARPFLPLSYGPTCAVHVP